MAQIFCRPFLNFSVGLFLFLSAILSNAKNWNPKKRIKKVLIPYVIWTLIYVILQNISTPSNIPIRYIKDLITGNASPIMYYVFVYCELTLLIPLIDKLAKSKYKYLGFAITPIEIIVMRIIPLVAGFEVNKYVKIIMSVSCLSWFTYYYLGYLIGNEFIKIKVPQKNLFLLWLVSIAIQMLEGYAYLSMGDNNCGTQVKLSSVLTGVLFALMAYNFIVSEKSHNMKLLKILGDNSFGIYFSHLAVQTVISHIPLYTEYVIYPINAIVVIFVTTICVWCGKKVLGKYSKYLAL